MDSKRSTCCIPILHRCIAGRSRCKSYECNHITTFACFLCKDHCPGSTKCTQGSINTKINVNSNEKMIVTHKNAPPEVVQPICNHNYDCVGLGDCPSNE